MNKTKIFDRRRSYDRDYDVRDHADWLRLLREQTPNGSFWALIAPRRHGKTWTLKAIQDQLGGATPADFVDLGKDKDSQRFLKGKSARAVLLDEPGNWLSDDGGKLSTRKAKTFLERCAKLSGDGVKIFAAMTPREFDCLYAAGNGKRLIDVKDRRYLNVLTDEQVTKLMDDVAWALDLKDQLPAAWKRNPFLLELLLEVAQKQPTVRTDLAKLLKEARETSHEAPNYFKQVFGDGLSDEHREFLRRIARGESPRRDEIEMLVGCGLVDHEDKFFSIADPIVAHHVPPPLRIHHISDIHVGEKSAPIVDKKAKGTHGDRLAQAASDPIARDAYLSHLRTLKHDRPHLLIVSGDIAERGEKELYDEFQLWLDDVEKELAEHPRIGGKPRVLLVGGNHDVNWTQVYGAKGARKRHVPFAEAFGDRYPHPLLEQAPEVRKLTVVEYPDADLAVCLLGSAEFGGEVEQGEAWTRVRNVVESFRKKAVAASKKKDWKQSKKLLDNIARIDPGLVHKKDLERLRRFDGNASVRIAVLHHPVSPMPAITEVARFAGLINAGEVKDALLAAGFTIVLHGHMHSGWFAVERWPGRHEERELVVVAAATLGSFETAEQQGFNELVLTFDGERCDVLIRRFGRHGKTWAETARLESKSSPVE